MFAVYVHYIIEIMKYSRSEARNVLFHYQPNFFLFHEEILVSVRHLIEDQYASRSSAENGNDSAADEKKHEAMHFVVSLRKPTREILLDFLSTSYIAELIIYSLILSSSSLVSCSLCIN